MINDIMADLRHSLRKLEGPAQRRIMMTYGARYKFLPGEPPEEPPTPTPAPLTPPKAGSTDTLQKEMEAAGV